MLKEVKRKGSKGTPKGVKREVKKGSKGTPKNDGSEARLEHRICSSSRATVSERLRHRRQRGCAERTRKMKAQREREGLKYDAQKGDASLGRPWSRLT